MSKTLYDVLEVIPTASQETIQAAYRSLIVRYHPDKVASLADEFKSIAEARTKEINSAYSILNDPIQRRKYDDIIYNKNTSHSAYTAPPASSNNSRAAPTNMPTSYTRKTLSAVAGVLSFLILTPVFLFVYVFIISMIFYSIGSKVTIIDLLSLLLEPTHELGFVAKILMMWGILLSSGQAFSVGIRASNAIDKKFSLILLVEICCCIMFLANINVIISPEYRTLTHFAFLTFFIASPIVSYQAYLDTLEKSKNGKRTGAHA